MTKAAEILGKEAVEVEQRVAVVRCNGTPEFRPRTSSYGGAPGCTLVNNLYGGESNCTYGCLGMGECVDACDFEAMYMDNETALPVIIDDKCVACGACVKACPRDIIELRKKMRKDRKIYVSCVNKDKGGPARKACKVACISCSKCFNVCEYEAITIDNNLAFIDSDKCKFCRKCEPECPTKSIHELNFPPRKPKVEKETEKIEV
jgi:ferredoxin